MPIQVTWELDDRNKDMEVEGLLEAAESVGSHSGFILTRDIEDQWIQRHVRINVTPVWKWLLEKEISA